MIKHALTDDILADYAAGNMAEAFNLVVAAHVSICPDARDRLHQIEEIGGALLEDGGRAALAEGSLQATLSRIRTLPRETAPAPKPARTACPVLPGPVQDYVGGSLADVRWRSLGMGARQAILATSKEASVRLLYIPAGSKMPDHGHSGTEMTLVLQGAFLDEGERFARGDVEVADEHVAHTPIADLGEDCVCLAASAGPLRFTGLLPRLAQPFFRI